MNMTMLRTLVLCFAMLMAAGLARTGQAADKLIGNYSYDDSGNVISIGPASDGLSNYYYYDSAGRLIRFARKPSASGTAVLEETYEYDAYGNLTKLTTNGSALPVPVSESTNRLTTAVYDPAGNVTNHDGVTYQFDPVGTLSRKAGSWGSAFYIYTADDERLGIEGPDGTWRYTLRDIDAKVLREWSASSWNGSLNWVEDYVYRDGRLTAALRPDSQGGTRHFHLDHLGTPRLITGPDGSQYASHDYYPFGREITDPQQEIARGFDTPEPMKFTGHERDFAGSFAAAPVDYMHARYYTPHLGRFLSIDPGMDLQKTLHEPQLWNRYAYVMNNPLNYTDPDGRVFRTFYKEKPMTGENVCCIPNGTYSAVDTQTTVGSYKLRTKILTLELTDAQVSVSAVKATAESTGPGVKGTVTVDVLTATGGVTSTLDSSKTGGMVEATAAAASVTGELSGDGASVTAMVCAGCATGGVNGGVDLRTGEVSAGGSASTGSFGGGVTIKLTPKPPPPQAPGSGTPPKKQPEVPLCGRCSIQ